METMLKPGNLPLLKVEGITKSFPGTRALSEVSLTVGYGEVHALMGENGAGKSTLVNIITGVIRHDSGRIFLEGEEVNFAGPKQSRNAGISFVRQEPALCPHLSIAENVFASRLPKTGAGFLVDYKRLNERCKNVLAAFRTDLEPWQKVGGLSLAQLQTVEIAKAVTSSCKLLVLDEPTSSLNRAETRILFDIIRKLKEKGVGILYITHRMDEVFEICDRVSVLRDGCLAGSINVRDASRETLMQMMTGKAMDSQFPLKGGSLKEEVIRVEGFTSGKIFVDASFSLFMGEILGFAGLTGSGRTGLMRAICGIDKKDCGQIYLRGKKVEIKSYYQAMKMGICYMPEDRVAQGIFLNMSVLSNMSAACLNRIKNKLLINRRLEKGICEQYLRILGIKTASLRLKADSLSGGNQQKVMLARALSNNPAILIMDEPTRGMDVGARSEIYKLTRQLANNGLSVILISSDLSEIAGMCDRVAVMREGKIAGIVEKDEISEDRIMRHIYGKSA
ncbi:MAG: sugar ABC transporter ATP-binding protein [Bacillota bacterium]